MWKIQLLRDYCLPQSWQSQHIDYYRLVNRGINFSRLQRKYIAVN